MSNGVRAGLTVADKEAVVSAAWAWLSEMLAGYSAVRTIPAACPTRSGRAGVALASRRKATMGREAKCGA
jgi:hypothetical protein